MEADFWLVKGGVKNVKAFTSKRQGVLAQMSRRFGSNIKAFFCLCFMRVYFINPNFIPGSSLYLAGNQ